MKQPGGHLVIESVRENGQTFRPSDWIERISTTLARFGPDNRLQYSSKVKPCIIEGQKCLVVARNLAEKEPDTYNFILKFARENQLRIQKDRRRSGR